MCCSKSNVILFCLPFWLPIFWTGSSGGLSCFETGQTKYCLFEFSWFFTFHEKNTFLIYNYRVFFMESEKSWKFKKAIFRLTCFKTRQPTRGTSPENGKPEGQTKQYYVRLAATHDILIIFMKVDKMSKTLFRLTCCKIRRFRGRSRRQLGRTRVLKKTIFRLTSCKTWFFINKWENKMQLFKKHRF
jgi:hypothetical protein